MTAAVAAMGILELRRLCQRERDLESRIRIATRRAGRVGALRVRAGWFARAAELQGELDEVKKKIAAAWERGGR